ncbi:MAG: hypothetical protein Q9208_001445 [Pyrenodesmia sp. 3 TL-2023]
MEILIRKRTDFPSATVLKQFLNPLLEPFQLSNPEIRILHKSRNHALLTTHKHRKASEFLQQWRRLKLWCLPKWHLEGEPLTIKLSYEKPNEFLIRVLQREEKLRLLQNYEKALPPSTLASPAPPSPREFAISSLSYGNWEYIDAEPHYHPYFEVYVDATVTFGDRFFVLVYNVEATENDKLGAKPIHHRSNTDGDSDDDGRPMGTVRLVHDHPDGDRGTRHHDIHKLINDRPSADGDVADGDVDGEKSPSGMVKLTHEYPNSDSGYHHNDIVKLVDHSPGDEGENEGYRHKLLFPYSAVASIALDPEEDQAVICTMTEAPKMWINDLRGVGLRGLPLQIATSCQVYRLRLSDPSDVRHLLRLEREGVFPQCSVGPVSAVEPSQSFVDQVAQLKAALNDPVQDLGFSVRFQAQKLAQNGYLPPRVVIGLIHFISHLQRRSGPTSTVAALRRLFQQLPYAGPTTKANELDQKAVVDLLNQNIEALAEESPYPFLGQTSDLLTIHRAEITPTAVYLAGPDVEAGNRVLRKYARFSEYFLRVTFMDENGDTFYFDKNDSNRAIFHWRFKDILNEGVEVAGRLFKFLGFSHSSLRAQTCWFLAPFTHDSKPIDADMIISGLGDFSHIRSPAKCAARIGQAFTETSSSTPIEPACVYEVEDVERNGRCFSDGVGTCSLSVLEELQAVQKSSQLPATVFQVRIAGAKGVISLDNRLEGDVLRLRPSMIKYRGSEESRIEICGVASRMLPLVLNRQLIKILEDLGIPDKAFQDLQEQAIDELRGSVSSVTNAAALLERHDVGLSTQTTWLLRKMYSLGLTLSEDTFFRDLLDAMVLIQLQELKYRTRIPVTEGATLYGIMDETGTLAEGEVFCSWIDREGRPNQASGVLVVTRSPALHPGDIQTAEAITVPAESPLSALHNCIVFSSKGARDLPSQLSGGDLDGDLYHVIWDEKLIPRSFARQDMSEFFVQFMEQDQLGRVATQHMVLADQHEPGTLHEDCIKLAELHSTAVDFSKTGRAVYESQLPNACRNNHYRPDFMAPGRKVKVEEHGIVFEPEEVDFLEDGDPRRAGEPKRKRYYESNKVLGILYRSIDERSFFKDLHERSAVLKDDDTPSRGVLFDLWDYVKAEVAGLEWEEYIDEAVRMRETYEAMVYDIILEYSTHPTEHLEEIEVFIGNIICRTGYRSKRQKEYMTGMKEKYDRQVLSLMTAMRADDVTGEGFEALRRSLACLWMGI